ncbi:dihydroxy-acid dehydratase domain-containing protein [Terrisporobacter sp.]|uniref:dihydroxy-acid dehydratase domain-containing protein n=1 Tax=Terrisporobacter sp. TaxID=1965305 RepID=UPI002FCC3A34
MREMLNPISTIAGMGLESSVASIGHVSPEATVGVSIALVKEGDMVKIKININIKDKTLDMDVSDEELEERRKLWVPREPKITTGYLRRYSKLVTSRDRGAVLQV